jgi:hypothetical protein
MQQRLQARRTHCDLMRRRSMRSVCDAELRLVTGAERARRKPLEPETPKIKTLNP